MEQVDLDTALGERKALMLRQMGAHLNALRKQRIEIGPEDEARVYRYFLTLLMRGTFPQEPDGLARCLSPLLARNRIEQQIIQDHFAGLARPVELDVGPQPEKPGVWDRIGPKAIRFLLVAPIIAIMVYVYFFGAVTTEPDASDLIVTPDGQVEAPEDAAKSHAQQNAAAGGQDQADDAETDAAIEQVDFLERVARNLVAVLLPVIRQLESLIVLNWNWVFLVSAMFTSALIAFRAVPRPERERKALRRVQGGQDAPQREMFLNGQREFYANARPVELLATLSLRRHFVTRQIDVTRTIEKARETLGRITRLVPVERSISVGHLILIERKSTGDLCAALGDILSHWFLGGEQQAVVWDYHNDPRRLLSAGGNTDARPLDLTNLLQRHPAAPVILVSDGHSLLDRMGRHAQPWLRELTEERPVALFTPVPPRDWGRPEAALLRVGLRLYALTKAAIEGYTRDVTAIFSGIAPAPQEIAQGRPRRRLHVPDRYIFGPEPSQEDVERLVLATEAQLSVEAFRLLVCLAFSPVADAEVLLALGEALRDRNDKPLANDQRLSELARLGWMREGYMPLWLCRALATGITDEDRVITSRTLTDIYSDASLNAGATGDPGFAFRVMGQDVPEARKKALQKKLEKSESRRDRLLEELIKSNSVDDLVVALHDDDDVQREAARKERQLKQYRVAAAFAAAMGVLAIWNPVTQFVLETGTGLLTPLGDAWVNLAVSLQITLAIGFFGCLWAHVYIGRLGERTAPRWLWPVACFGPLFLFFLNVLLAGSVQSLDRPDTTLWQQSPATYDDFTEILFKACVKGAGAALVLAGAAWLLRKPSPQLVSMERMTAAESIAAYFGGVVSLAIAFVLWAAVLPPTGPLGWRVDDWVSDPRYLGLGAGVIFLSSYLLNVSSFAKFNIRLGLPTLLTQRAMVPYVLIGCYAAGLGLDALPILDDSSVDFAETHAFFPAGFWLLVFLWLLYATRLNTTFLSLVAAAVVIIIAIELEASRNGGDSGIVLLFAHWAFALLIFVGAAWALAGEPDQKDRFGFWFAVSFAASLFGFFVLGVLSNVVVFSGLESVSDELVFWDLSPSSQTRDSNVLNPLHLAFAVCALLGFCAWLVAARALFRHFFSVAHDTLWRASMPRAWLWAPVLAFSTFYVVTDSVTFNFFWLYYLLCFYIGARAGQAGFWTVAVTSALLIPNYGLISEVALQDVFTFLSLGGSFVYGGSSGLGLGAALAGTLLAYLSARQQSIAPFLSRQLTGIAACATLAAALMLSVYLDLGGGGISLSLYPALYISAFLIGLGRNQLQPILFAIGILFVGSSVVEALADTSFGRLSLTRAVNLAVILWLGRLMRHVCFRPNQFLGLVGERWLNRQLRWLPFVLGVSIVYSTLRPELYFIVFGSDVIFNLQMTWTALISAFVLGFAHPRWADRLALPTMLFAILLAVVPLTLPAVGDTDVLLGPTLEIDVVLDAFLILSIGLSARLGRQMAINTLGLRTEAVMNEVHGHYSVLQRLVHPQEKRASTTRSLHAFVSWLYTNEYVTPELQRASSVWNLIIPEAFKRDPWANFTARKRACVSGVDIRNPFGVGFLDFLHVLPDASRYRPLPSQMIKRGPDQLMPTESNEVHPFARPWALGLFVLLANALNLTIASL